MPDGVRVEGGREFRKALKGAGDDLGELKEAHGEAATIVAGFAATTAPRKSGALGASTRGSGTTSAAIIRAGKKSVPYAGPIHWGWRRRGIAARPWISTAAQTTESRWTGAYLAAVQRLLERIRGI